MGPEPGRCGCRDSGPGGKYDHDAAAAVPAAFRLWICTQFSRPRISTIRPITTPSNPMMARTVSVNLHDKWFWLRFREADELPIAAEVDTRSGCERSRSLVWRGDGSLQVGGARARIVMTWRHG